MLKGLGVAESLAEQTGERKDIILVKNYYDRIGNTQLDTGDVVGALKNYRRSQELSERLAARNPSNNNQAGIAISHSYVGEALAATGDLVGAIEEYKQSLDTFEAIAEKEPDNLAHARGMMIAYFWLGRLSGNPGFLNMGDKAAALEYYRKAMAIAERLAATDAKNASYRLDRIGSYINVADMIYEDDPAQAADLYRRAMAFVNITLETEPNESRFLTRRARCLKGQAAIMERAGDRRGAQQNLSQALEILRKLAEANPSNLGLQADLYTAWNAMGDLALRAGNTSVAQENYREALALAEKALAAAPAHLYSKWRLADSCSRMGKLHVAIASGRNRADGERAANWREARDWYKKAVDVWDRWSREAVSSAFNTARRDQAARSLAECEAALNALENATHSARSNRKRP
ncbi:MAG: hypothetical protein L0229_22025 [Blastocatellia bacterium]|nr:hypothetical protein [Blastocatellia bacterium]